MVISRRSLLRKSARVVGAMAFADVLGLDRVLNVDATQCTPPYRSQFDGSYCCCMNCHAAACAMMRAMQSCGAYAPSAASMRVWYNRQAYQSDCGPANSSCSSCRTTNCGTQSLCPGGGVLLYDYMALTHPYDGGPKYATELHNATTPSGCDLGRISMATLQLRLTPNSYDWSAVVNGDYSQVPYKCDTASGYHSVFALYYSSASGFLVYDPDNANSCSQPRWWTTAQMTAFAGSYAGSTSGYACCILGKAVQTTPC